MPDSEHHPLNLYPKKGVEDIVVFFQLEKFNNLVCCVCRKNQETGFENDYFVEKKT